ncbi:hypothetical protein [Tabrizicola sp.]|uniref:hypothetical protein n=1 Tax=Tabrizicola sp. TaxID=2005166 RepID=UPI003F3849CB
MNRGILPIVARLQSLQTVARFVPGGARVIAKAHDRNQLAQLLRAANETVLGRSLRFESASGPSITLDVAGRRVLRLSAADGLPGADACLAAEALEDEHKDELIKLMQTVAAPRHELRVTSGPIGRGAEGVSVGLPVALLADLLLIELNEADVEEPEPVEPSPEPEAAEEEAGDVSGDMLARFARNLGPTLIAWLIAGGENDGNTNGPEEMVSHLQNFLGDETEALNRQLDAVANLPGDPICVILGVTLVEDHSIVCARSETAMLLGVIEGDATKVVLPAWNKALR